MENNDFHSIVFCIPRWDLLLKNNTKTDTVEVIQIFDSITIMPSHFQIQSFTYLFNSKLNIMISSCHM